MSQNVFFLAACKKEKSRAIILGSSAYQKADIDVSGVKQLLESQNNLETGKHYSFIPGEVAWHLIQDEFGLIYVVLVKQFYPQRVAHAFLEDLQKQFTRKVGGHAATEAKEKAYDRTCATLFSDLLARYNNLAEVDKLSAVSQKIDAVKMTMQENVSMALSNCVKLEQIEQATEELQQQAGVFKKNAHDLKNKMWWKNMKLWLIIGLIVLIIIGIIVGVAVAQSKASSGGN